MVLAPYDLKFKKPAGVASLPPVNPATVEPSTPSAQEMPTGVSGGGAGVEALSPSPAPTQPPAPTPALPSQPPSYTDYLKSQGQEAASRHGVDWNILNNLISHESGWNPSAFNKESRAAGLGQFIPSTAADYGIDPFNPAEALDASARYLQQSLQQFGGDYDKALASYYIGPGNVQKAVAEGGANWLAVADRIIRDLGQPPVSQYIQSIKSGTTATASANPGALLQPYQQTSPLTNSTALAGVNRQPPSLPSVDFPQPTQPLTGSVASGSPFSPALQQSFMQPVALQDPSANGIAPNQGNSFLDKLQRLRLEGTDLSSLSLGRLTTEPYTNADVASFSAPGGPGSPEAAKERLRQAEIVSAFAGAPAPQLGKGLLGGKGAIVAENIANLAAPKLAQEANLPYADTTAGQLAYSLVPSLLAHSTPLAARKTSTILRRIAEGGEEPDLETLLRQSIDGLKKADPTVAKGEFLKSAQQLADQMAAESKAQRRPYRDTANLRKKAGQLADALDALTGNKPEGPVSQVVGGRYEPARSMGENVARQQGTEPPPPRISEPDISPLRRDELERQAAEGITKSSQRGRYTPPTENFNTSRTAANRSPMLAEEAQADIENPHGLLRRVVEEAGGTLGTATALKSMLSPPILRQGLVRLVTAPFAAAREAATSFRAAVSDETAQGINRIIDNDPWVSPHSPPTAVSQMHPVTNPANQGLSWKEVGGDLIGWKNGTPIDLQPEELQMLDQSWLGRKIRQSKVGQLSERQAATSVNLYRTNWYRSVASNMFKAGERRQDEYVKLRKFIEHATQRGSVSQKDLPLMFSSRAASGRIQFLGDLLSYGTRGILTGQALKPGVHQEAAKSLIGLTAAGLALFGTLKELGIGTIEMNDGLPTLKVGDQHFDPWAGLNTAIKAVVRTGQDIEAAYKKGINPEDLPQEFVSIVGSRALDMLRSGLGPVWGKATDIATKENFLGRPYNLATDVKSGNILMDVAAPFILQDIYEAFRHDGLAGVARTAPASFLSTGVNTYTATPDIGKQEVQNGIQSGSLPRTYLDVNGQPRPVTNREQLQQADPLAYDQYLQDNPKVAEQLSATESAFTRGIHEVQSAAKTEQEARDKKYLDPTSPDYNPAVWRDLTSEARKGVQKVLDDRFTQHGEFQRDPRGLLDVANQKLHEAIVSATNPDTHEIDWDAVDKVRNALSPAEQDLLDKQSLAGETKAYQDYKKALKDLVPYFQQRDEGWKRIFGNTSLGQYANLDEFHQSLVSRLVKSGVPLSIANAEVDKAVAPIQSALSPFSTAYLVRHRDLLPELDRWGFFVPANLRPLLLVGKVNSGTGVNRGP